MEEQVPHRRHAQPLTGDAEAGAVRRLFAFAEPPGGLEDLSDRQIGQQPHGQHHPQDDLVRQPTLRRIDPASGREHLLNVLGADHLFESRQSIQNPARVVGRQRAMSLWHASHSLLGALLVGKPKVTGGCDLRLFQRYWGLARGMTDGYGADVGTEGLPGLRAPVGWVTHLPARRP